jgi:hypothetical protein
MPGVLFRMTCQWRQGVCLRTHLAVGLHDSIIPGASVRGKMCMIGVLSIALCSASWPSWGRLLLTLCSLVFGGQGKHSSYSVIEHVEQAFAFWHGAYGGRTIGEFVCYCMQVLMWSHVQKLAILQEQIGRS